LKCVMHEKTASHGFLFAWCFFWNTSLAPTSGLNFRLHTQVRKFYRMRSIRHHPRLQVPSNKSRDGRDTCGAQS
jgi:hypothetical protein